MSSQGGSHAPAPSGRQPGASDNAPRPSNPGEPVGASDDNQSGEPDHPQGASDNSSGPLNPQEQPVGRAEAESNPPRPSNLFLPRGSPPPSNGEFIRQMRDIYNRDKMTLGPTAKSSDILSPGRQIPDINARRGAGNEMGVEERAAIEEKLRQRSLSQWYTNVIQEARERGRDYVDLDQFKRLVRELDDVSFQTVRDLLPSFGHKRPAGGNGSRGGNRKDDDDDDDDDDDNEDTRGKSKKELRSMYKQLKEVLTAKEKEISTANEAKKSAEKEKEAADMKRQNEVNQLKARVDELEKEPDKKGLRELNNTLMKQVFDLRKQSVDQEANIRDLTIQTLMNSVQEKDQELQDKNNEIKGKEEDIEKRNKEIQTQKEQIETKDQQLHDKDTRISDLVKELEECEEHRRQTQGSRTDDQGDDNAPATQQQDQTTVDNDRQNEIQSLRNDLEDCQKHGNELQQKYDRLTREKTELEVQLKRAHDQQATQVEELDKRLEECRAHGKELDERIETLTRENNDLVTRLKEAADLQTTEPPAADNKPSDEDIQKLRKDLEECQANGAQLAERNRTLASDLEKANQDNEKSLRASKAEAETLRQQIKDQASDLNECREKCRSLGKQVEELKTPNGELGHQYQEQLNEIRQELEERNTKLTTDLKEARDNQARQSAATVIRENESATRVTELEADRTACRANGVTLAQENQQLRDEITRLTTNAESQEARNNQATQSAATVTPENESAPRITQLEAELAACQANVETLRRANQQLRDDITRLEADAEAQNQTTQSLQPQLNTAPQPDINPGSPPEDDIPEDPAELMTALRAANARIGQLMTIRANYERRMREQENRTTEAVERAVQMSRLVAGQQQQQWETERNRLTSEISALERDLDEAATTLHQANEEAVTKMLSLQEELRQTVAELEGSLTEKMQTISAIETWYWDQFQNGPDELKERLRPLKEMIDDADTSLRSLKAKVATGRLPPALHSQFLRHIALYSIPPGLERQKAMYLKECRDTGVAPDDRHPLPMEARENMTREIEVALSDYQPSRAPAQRALAAAGTNTQRRINNTQLHLWLDVQREQRQQQTGTVPATVPVPGIRTTPATVPVPPPTTPVPATVPVPATAPVPETGTTPATVPAPAIAPVPGTRTTQPTVPVPPTETNTPTNAGISGWLTRVFGRRRPQEYTCDVPETTPRTGRQRRAPPVNPQQVHVPPARFQDWDYIIGGRERPVPFFSDPNVNTAGVRRRVAVPAPTSDPVNPRVADRPRRREMPWNRYVAAALVTLVLGLLCAASIVWRGIVLGARFRNGYGYYYHGGFDGLQQVLIFPNWSSVVIFCSVLFYAGVMAWWFVTENDWSDRKALPEEADR